MLHRLNCHRCGFINRIFWAAFLFAAIGFQHASATIEIHVAGDGRDNQSGSVQAPVATLLRALELARSARKQPGANHEATTITLHEGIYFSTNSLELSSADSGTAESPLRIQAAPGEKVLLHGGVRIGAESLEIVTDPMVLARLPEEARGKVWFVNLKARGITDFGVMQQHGFGTPACPGEMEVFVDGQPWHLARYPNVGTLKIGRIIDKGSVPRNGDKSNRGAIFGYEYERANRWTNIADVWLHGRFNNGYADDNLRIASIDPVAHTIRLAQPHIYGVKSSLYPASPGDKNLGEGASLRGYYAYNLLEELDAPGEYYLDRQTGMLYLYGETRPARATIDLSLRTEPFLSLRGVHDVTIAGLNFVCSRGMGIYQQDTAHVTIEGCVFRNLGTVAVSMGQRLQMPVVASNSDGSPSFDFPGNAEFQSNTIANCQIANNGTGGVIISGGDRRKLKPGNNLVCNCEFFGNSRRNETYSPSVKLFGVGNTVRGCYFHDQRHQSIGYQGNNFLIEQNLFARDCEDSDDMGVLYTGRDPSARGTIIRRNFFTDILPPDRDTKMCAIYVDDGSGGITIQQNIFCRAGNPGPNELFGSVFFNGGHDNVVEENVFIECLQAVGDKAWPDERWTAFLAGPLMQQRLTKDVDIASATYLTAYPELVDYFDNRRPRLNTIRGNLFYDTQLTTIGEYSLKANHLLPATGIRSVSGWTLALVATQFGTVSLVENILSEPIGLSRREFDRWHPCGPEGKD